MEKLENNREKHLKSTSTTINWQKGNDEIESQNESKVITEEMVEEISAICNCLFIDSVKFEDNKKATFNRIYEYIKKYKRIIYSQISSVIYACYDRETHEEATNRLGTMSSNVEKLIAYTGSAEYEKEKGSREKEYQDAEKALIKIYDHINLAQLQYSGLKQTDAEYSKKFNDSIRPVKDKLVKEMNAQLLTLVGIFTALSFVLFGGISSLDSIFEGIHTASVLRLIMLGSIWGLCMLNLIFVFLFCAAKMTKLPFASTEDKDATIFEKYPIFWWTNYIVISILAASSMIFYFIKTDMLKWLDELCRTNPRCSCFVAVGILLLIIVCVGVALKSRCVYKEKK